MGCNRCGKALEYIQESHTDLCKDCGELND